MVPRSQILFARSKICTNLYEIMQVLDQSGGPESRALSERLRLEGLCWLFGFGACFDVLRPRVYFAFLGLVHF